MRLHFGHDLPGVTPRAAARITAASSHSPVKEANSRRQASGGAARYR
jgi:hypothetical protein